MGGGWIGSLVTLGLLMGTCPTLLPRHRFVEYVPPSVPPSVVIGLQGKSEKSERT